MKKYKYNISNLTCMNCAKKIENALNNHKDIESAVLNFNTLKLTIETDNEKPLELVKKIVSKIEPEVLIYENEINNNSSKNEIIRLLIGIILGIIGVSTNIYFISFILSITGYGLLLSRTIKNAYNLLVRSKTINENFLITISCIGAYLVGEHMEGLMVITLYEIGKILENKAVNKSRNSIKELMDIKPEYANLKTNDGYIEVSPEEVNIGDVITQLNDYTKTVTNENNHFIITNEYTAVEEDKNDVPQTGKESNIYLYLITMVIGLIGFISTTLKLKNN